MRYSKLSSSSNYRSNRSRDSNRQLQIEPLEDRTLMHGTPFDDVATTQVDQLESNPGAAHTLYLDFNGHVTNNSGRHTVTVAEFNFDNGPGFSPREEAAIRDVWTHVAEDFAPFDVNVTTIESQDLRRGGNPTGRALRIAIGQITPAPAPRVAGFSPLGSYNNRNIENTAFVEATRLLNNRQPNRDLALVASHEAGHAYGLKHLDPTRQIRDRARYEDWSPLMVSGAYSSRSTWYRGPDHHGNIQDDAVVLEGVLGLRADDHSDDITQAQDLSQVPTFAAAIGTSTTLNSSGNRLFGTGIIETTRDRDVFKFKVTGSGPVAIRSIVGPGVDAGDAFPDNGNGANLDSMFVVRDSSGRVVVAANSVNRLSELGTLQTAPLVLPTMPGMLQIGSTYYVEVGSHGRDGDLGHYTVTVTGNVRSVDTSGPAIVGATLASPTSLGNVAGPASNQGRHVLVTFNEPIDPCSIDPADITMHGPNGRVPVRSVAAVNLAGTQHGRQLLVEFSTTPYPGSKTNPGSNSANIYGNYTLTVMPTLRDLVGNVMDQNGNGSGGETGDKYSASFALQRTTQEWVPPFTEDLEGKGLAYGGFREDPWGPEPLNSKETNPASESWAKEETASQYTDTAFQEFEKEGYPTDSYLAGEISDSLKGLGQMAGDEKLVDDMLAKEITAYKF
ncbi:MAG TPA: Ig-like domain-containing protein [Pirellulales bacterium]|jgi:hypothetical protein|nr:Ig-like domain-containing protein [Pirellulales bacterium]